jgi:type I restriction enzyme S subunit
VKEKVSIKKLLEGVEVEWELLSNVAEYEQPTKYLVKTKNYDDDWDTPVLTAGKTFILGYTDEIEGINKASGDPVIIFDDFTTANKWVDFDFKVKSSAMKMITSGNESKYLLRFIYYWLNTLPSELIDGDHKRQWISNYSNKLIPIPHPDIQKEIVRILDNFTELTAELTAELKGRKQQYSYYRDTLLTFEEGDVEWKALGDPFVGELVRGNGLPKRDFTETGVPAIHYGQIYTYYGSSTIETKSFVSIVTAKKLRKVDTGDVIITNTSENLEDVGKALAYLGTVQAVTGGHATIFKPSKNILGKYLVYYTQTDMFSKQKIKYAKGAKVIDVSAKDMAKIIIPMPSPTEQERIISILDKFDTLTNSISEGLPKEIKLREQQYEYYRNMLLSFPKLEEA